MLISFYTQVRGLLQTASFYIQTGKLPESITMCYINIFCGQSLNIVQSDRFRVIKYL